MPTVMDILYEEEVVGTAKIEKRGLYYFFSCKCRFPVNGIYSIEAISGARAENLGICIPDADGYTLCKRVPVKHFEGDILRLIAVNRKRNAFKRFPLSEQEPFSYIADLERATYLGGVDHEIMIQDPVPAHPSKVSCLH